MTEGRRILPKSVYADNVDSSLRKWLDCINEPETRGQDQTELKTFLNQGRQSQIKRVDYRRDTYFLTLTKDNSHLTVIIREFEVTPDLLQTSNIFRLRKVDERDLQHRDIVLMLRFPFSKNATSGEQIFWDRDMVFPGETVRAQIRILDHDTFKNALHEGIEFEFCEGVNVVGTGV